MSATEWDSLLSTVEAQQRPLYDANFPEQRAFIEDPSQFVTLLCTRRAGKSFGMGLRLIRAAQKHPGSSCLFIALTRISAEAILWKDVLKVINRDWKLGATFHEAKLRMDLPNGSQIFLLGADADEEEREKLLGRKFAEVGIDEAAAYSIDINALVYGILKPAVADYRGTICLIGTPGNLKTGLFFELTKDQNPLTPGRWSTMGWSGHRWSADNNPHMREKWRGEMEDLLRDRPGIEETPLFQQMYFGRWVIDDTRLVYRYTAGRNDYTRLPVFTAGSWHYVLAVDLGFNDACAFTVLAYHDFTRVLFIIRVTKKTGLDITATAEEMKALQAEFNVETTVVDGANKQAVEEMNNRHGTNALPADKRDKADFIDLMNSEFIQGNIRLGPECDPLREEYVKLVWDERKLAKRKREEHPNCANHATDTGLYGWRWCYPYIAEKPRLEPKKLGEEGYAEEVLKRAQEQEEAQMAAEFEANQREKDEREDSAWL